MKNRLILLLWLAAVPLFSQTEKGITPVRATLVVAPQNTTYAVVVGISDYQDEGIPDLRFADKDALAFAGFLQSPAGGSLDEDHLKVLINEKASVAQFAIALDWLMEVTKENDRVVIYFSGHGDVERKTITQPGYLLCWDAPAKIYLAGGALALPMFQDVITTLSVQNKAKVIVITDACRSGKLSGSTVGGSQITGNNLAKQYANEIKILSCQPDEYSIEGEQWGGGRGAFSYHLLDGLYGMADGNADNTVNLKELGRYLEDRVSAEVAPQNQNPMTIGGVTEKLTDVFSEILAQLKAGKKGQMPMFTATVSRGIEDDVLAAADSNVVALYFAFQKALADKQFLFAEKGRPENDFADFYFEKLIAEPSLEPLHSSIRRNYAAALQDDAQQVMNEWMKTSQDKVLDLQAGKKKNHQPTKVFTERIMAFPACLDRAAELLGKAHYMYATLQARKHFFEGYLLANFDRNPNKELGDNALAAFRQALEWQPELPQAYWQMINVYGNNLLQPDSAEVYAQKAMALYPTWVTPYTNLAFLLTERYKLYDRARPYMEQALQIDSSSADVVSLFGIFYSLLKEYGQAEKQFKKAIQLDSTVWQIYGSFGNFCVITHRYDEAEKYLQKAIQLDSTAASPCVNLGLLYSITGRFDEAEKLYKKAIQLDSTNTDAYNNLGIVYSMAGRFDEGEKLYKKSLQLDSTDVGPYDNLGLLYSITRRYDEAEKYLKKSLQLDSANTYTYTNLGIVYSNTRRYDEAEEQLKIALQLDTALWTAYECLGFLYQTLQRWEESETMILKSIKCGPPIGELPAILGNAYTHLPGKMDAAKKELDKAIEMSPDWPDTYIYLARWNLKNNQPEQAWLYLEQGLEKGIGKGQLRVEDLQEAPDFAGMREEPKWGELMKKYFPEQFKD